MAGRLRRSHVSTGGLLIGANGLRAREDSGTGVDGRSMPPHVAFVSMWAFALASGLVAFGLTEVIGALVAERSVRVSLQFATIPAVAVVAGLTCEGTLMRVRSAIGGRHQQR
jgi:hypothetical protein